MRPGGDGGLASRLPAHVDVGRIVFAALLSLAFALTSGVSKSAEPANDLAVPKGVQVSLLLIQPGSRVAASGAFDIDQDGVPVVAEGPVLRVLGSSKQLVSVGVSSIDDFAWMRNGAPLFITQDHLVGFGPKGLTRSIALPSSSMRIRPAGANTAYVFGESKERGIHTVYLLARDRTLAKLATLPTPVIDVVGDGTTTYVATGRTVLRISRRAPAAAMLQTRDDITSLAFGPKGGLFYATKSGVGYVGSTGTAYEFMRGQSGILRVQGSSLFVLIREGPHLIRINPIEAFEKLLPP